MKSPLQSLRDKTRVRPLRSTIRDLASWYTTPLGQDILRSQKRILAQQLSCLFGYHLMQLSVIPDEKLFSSSRINHCFSFSPVSSTEQRFKCVKSLAEFEALPLDDEVIDVTLLHHVLEFSQNPQQVLKEAARVTIPNGYIVLLGFNPASMLGVIKPFAQVFSSKVIWRRKTLRIGRIKDWLEFLDFSCLDVRYTSFNLPINNKNYLSQSRYLRKFFVGREWPFGGTYCLLARKDKVGLTPIKPTWDPQRLMDVVPLPKRSVSAQVSAKILPLRRRNLFKRSI